MLVGNKCIDTEELRKYCVTVTTLTEYSDSLVPKLFRHNKSIINNQRYLVSVHVRRLKSLPYQSRKSLCEGLLEDVSITGIINELYDIEDLLMEIDEARLMEYIKKEVQNRHDNR